MRWCTTFRLRVRGWFRPRTVTQQIEEELRFHLEQETEALVAQGMTPREARDEAERRFGPMSAVRHRCHDAYYVRQSSTWRGDMLGQDIRFALRALRKSPGFTLVAVLTLAIGIGANSAMFTLVNTIVLRPLPYPEAHELASLWHSYPRSGLMRASVSPPNFRDYRAETGIWEDVAAYTFQNYTLTGDGPPTRLVGLRVSANLYTLLGVVPALGRSFRPEESDPGNEFVALLSHTAWTNQFGADPGVVGQSVLLDDQQYEVIGILPESHHFSVDPDVVVPLAFTPDQLGDDRRGQEFLAAVGRRAPGVTLDEARAGMTEVARRIDETYQRGGFQIEVVDLHQDVIGADVRPALFVLLGAVGFVLLIGCANVANLLFARAEGRGREVAVRAALGATRRRLVQQLVTESMVLGALGGLAGIGVAYAGVSLVTALPNLDLPRTAEVRVDGTIVAFTAAVSLMTGLLFGLGPALRTAGDSLSAPLREGGRRTIGARSGSRMRRLLVVSEVTLAIVLLVGAGLMMKSFSRLMIVDPGFTADDVLTLQVSLPAEKYPDNSTRAAFFRSALERVRSLPGVSAAGAIMPFPMGGGNWSGSFRVEGEQYGQEQPMPNTKMRYVTTDYFRTMQIPVRSGRTFSDFDGPDQPRVIVVDQEFVDRYLPGKDPFSTTIIVGDSLNIVGIVGNVQDQELGGEINGHIYYPHGQAPLRTMALMIRAAAAPTTLTGPVIAELQTLDPTQAPFDVRLMRDRVTSSVSGSQFATLLLGLFAGIALLLAAIGIYGVLAYSVSQRTNEIGVRTALGADARAVIGMVVRQGMLPTLTGVGLGVVVSLAATRALRSMLFEISPADPLVYGGVATVIVGVSLVACYLPAVRATRVSPIEALRYE